MSITGLYDSVIALCRLSQAGSDSYGDVSSTPVLVQDFKGALSTARLYSHDEGAGDMPIGTMVLYYPKDLPIVLGDVIFVRKGPMAGGWWALLEPSQIGRARHREVYARPYVGEKPVL